MSIKSLNKEFKLSLFDEISEFVKFLHSIIKEKTNPPGPITLYNHFISHVKFSDIKAIDKSIIGFIEFTINNKDKFSDLTQISQTEKIYYKDSETIYIPIGKLISTLKGENYNLLVEKILRITYLINPDDKNVIDAISLFNEKTNIITVSKQSSGGFERIIKKAEDIAEKIKSETNLQGNEDPSKIMEQIISSGVMPEIVNTVKEEFESGNVSIPDLIGGLMGTLSGLTSNSEGMENNPLNLMDIMNGFLGGSGISKKKSENTTTIIEEMD